MTPDDIKSVRTAAGLTQAALAELLGVTPRAVKYWESGQRNMPVPAKKLFLLEIERLQRDNKPQEGK